MTIKLVACDLDGTLMGETLTFSPRLRRAIEQANKQGIVVTIATGRGFPSTQQYARQLGITAPVICYQGAQIKTQDGHTLYEATLSRAFLPGVPTVWPFSTACTSWRTRNGSQTCSPCVTNTTSPVSIARR